jgi:hypothetical protein
MVAPLNDMHTFLPSLLVQMYNRLKVIFLHKNKYLPTFIEFVEKFKKGNKTFKNRQIKLL